MLIPLQPNSPTATNGFTFTTNLRTSTTYATSAICPDLLRYELLGEADSLRGRVVRAFFQLMRLWPVR